MIALAAGALRKLWLTGAAMRSDPAAGCEVERLTADVLGLCTVTGEPEEVVPAEAAAVAAPLPNLAQAFFHLHWVHHRSLCSRP